MLNTSADVWAFGVTLYDLFNRNDNPILVLRPMDTIGQRDTRVKEGLEVFCDRIMPRLDRYMGHDPFGKDIILRCLQVDDERPTMVDLCRMIAT